MKYRLAFLKRRNIVREEPANRNTTKQTEKGLVKKGVTINKKYHRQHERAETDQVASETTLR